MAQNLSPMHKEDFHSFNHDPQSMQPLTTTRTVFDPTSLRIGTLKSKRLIIDIFKTCLPSVITVAFLAFCYSVQSRTVLVDARGLINVSPENLSAIKSGVTTISILIISLGLWPIKSLLTDLRGEEFIRSLQGSSSGVDLATANVVSSSSLGTFHSIVLIIKRRCTPHFAVAFLSGFIVIAASALAPATLSAEESMRDSEIMAFEVGAIPSSSVMNITNNLGLGAFFGSITDPMANFAQQASSIAWAETALDLNYSFSISAAPADNAQYIVPLPVKLSPKMTARWLTDVFVLRPSCSWATTNISNTLVIDGNITQLDNANATILLPSTGISFGLSGFILDQAQLSITLVSSSISVWQAVNATTGDSPLGGYTIWGLAQPTSTTGLAPLLFDSSGLRTFRVTANEGTWEFAILVCSPNLSIETREVQNSGNQLTVSAGRFSQQGNLNKHQGEFFFSSLLTSLGDSSSPGLIRPDSTQILASLFFGWDQVRSLVSDNTVTSVTLLPISNITDLYSTYIRSAAKIYMTGTFGTAFVPGVVSESVVVFTTSRAHVIVSTILLILLCCFVGMAFFRSGKGEIFGLLQVASLLHKSNVPGDLAQFREENSSAKGEVLQNIFEDASKDRILSLDKSAGTTGVLVVQDRNQY